MKPFRFSLQSVRVIRERKEQVAQEHYAVASRDHELAAQQLRQANTELAASWEALCQQVSLGAAASDLRRARAWCAALETRQRERATELQKARYTLDTASRELMAATRERQAMDRLHDKQRAAYQLEAQREEQKVLDEMGLRSKFGGELLRAWSPTTATML
jgi:flagellar export protein FliJ